MAAFESEEEVSANKKNQSGSKGANEVDSLVLSDDNEE